MGSDDWSVTDANVENRKNKPEYGLQMSVRCCTVKTLLM